MKQQKMKETYQKVSLQAALESVDVDWSVREAPPHETHVFNNPSLTVFITSVH